MDNFSATSGAFRNAATAFVLELDRVAAESTDQTMSPDAIEGFAHQIGGVADLFGATQTAVAAKALERAMRLSADPTTVAGLLAALAVIMRADAARLRQRLAAPGDALDFPQDDDGPGVPAAV